jgi:hypothetical protein
MSGKKSDAADEGGGDDKDGAVGFSKTLAALFESVPVIGKPLAAFTRAPLAHRWRIIRFLVIALLYPIYSLLVVLLAVQFISKDYRPAVQDTIARALGVDAQSKSNINTDHAVTDGTYLFEFPVTSSNITGDSYIASLTPGQALEFTTYQVPLKVGLGSLPECPDMPSTVPPASGVGMLTITTSTSDFERDKAVPASNSLLKRFYQFGEDEWAAARKAGPVNTPFNMVISYVPNKYLIDRIAGCSGYVVYVAVTYSKPPLP